MTSTSDPTHYIHIEELALKPGGIKQAVNEISLLLKDLPNTTVRLEAKAFDGSPGFVAGIDPDDKKFFVSYKKSFTKKEPVVYKSLNELKNNFKENMILQQIFIDLFNGLKPIIKKNIYNGDILFSSTSGNKKIETIGNLKHVSFLPNTLKTAIPYDPESKLFSQITKAKLGINIHTKMIGSDLKSVSSSFGVDVEKERLKSTNNTWITDSKIKNVSNKIKINNKIKNKIISRLGTVDHIGNSIEDKDYIKLKPILNKMEPYVNKLVRMGSKKGLSASKKMIKGLINDIKSKLKSKSGKISKEKMISDESLRKIMLSYKLLFEIKILLVKMFDDIEKKIKTFAKFKNNKFVVSPIEGYVIISGDKKNIIKLVDRFNFSALNFRSH